MNQSGISTEPAARKFRSDASETRRPGPHRPRRPPAPLLWLLAATAILGCGWALFLPPFQAPDEIAHVAYVQSLAERGELPGNAARPLQSSEQQLASNAANAEQTAQQLPVKPEWSDVRHESWLKQQSALPPGASSDGGGPNPASSNPPLYYLWLVAPYELASSGDFFARISAMRLASVPLLMVTVAAAWLLAGTVFGPQRPLQLAAASLPALLPMVTFVSSSVTPDAMLYALSGLVLWLGARVIVGRARLPDVVALGLLAGLAVLSKATAYALLPAVLLAVAGGAWRARGDMRRLVVVAVVAVAAFALVLTPWLLIARANDRPGTGQLAGASPASAVNVRELGSYVWQYYLPRLPFQAEYVPLDGYPQAYKTWFKQGVGAFGYLEVRWPPAVYLILFVAWVGVVAAAALALIRRRRRLDFLLLAYFAAAVVSLLAGLHWSEYRIAESSGALLSQGRYLFPLLPLAGLIVAAALTTVPISRRPAALGALLGGLLVLQLAGIGLVATRFYV